MLLLLFRICFHGDVNRMFSLVACFNTHVMQDAATSTKCSETLAILSDYFVCFLIVLFVQKGLFNRRSLFYGLNHVLYLYWLEVLLVNNANIQAAIALVYRTPYSVHVLVWSRDFISVYRCASAQK